VLTKVPECYTANCFKIYFATELSADPLGNSFCWEILPHAIVMYHPCSTSVSQRIGQTDIVVLRCAALGLQIN